MSTRGPKRKEVLELFFRHVNKNGPIPEYRPDLGPCHLWLGKKSKKGYGQWNTRGKTITTHIVAFEAACGPVPESLQLDHLCRVRICCNPTHLEPVTAAMNFARGIRADMQRAITHCPTGHPYDAKNTYWYTYKSTSRRAGQVKRDCKQCRRKKKRHDSRQS